MPLYRVDFFDHFGGVFHSELVEASDAGPALGWAVLAANDRGLRFRGFHLKAREVVLDGSQLVLNLAMPKKKPVRVVRPARLVCGYWPNISGECDTCNHHECERSRVNRRS